MMSWVESSHRYRAQVRRVKSDWSVLGPLFSIFVIVVRECISLIFIFLLFLLKIPTFWIYFNDGDFGGCGWKCLGGGSVVRWHGEDERGCYDDVWKAG